MCCIIWDGIRAVAAPAARLHGFTVIEGSFRFLLFLFLFLFLLRLLLCLLDFVVSFQVLQSSILVTVPTCPQCLDSPSLG